MNITQTQQKLGVVTQQCHLVIKILKLLNWQKQSGFEFEDIKFHVQTFS